MLTDMVSGGENEEALKYLASMGAFMENSEEYVATGNEKIDSILNYMISKAKDSGIDVSWKIQIPEDCREVSWKPDGRGPGWGVPGKCPPVLGRCRYGMIFLYI